MNVTLRAAGKAAKQSLRTWIVGILVVFLLLAWNTAFFTKKPSWLDWYYTHYSSDFSPSAGASSNG